MATLCAFGFLLLALGALATTGDASDDASCYADNCLQESGQALLQIRRSAALSIMTESPLVPGLGSTADLDSDGFEDVKALCCSEEMMAFAKRLLVQEEYTLCLVGGLAGAIQFYDCDIEDGPAQNFTELKNAFKRGADKDGNCPWLVKEGEVCGERYETCKGYPNASFPPCKANDYICCGNETDFPFGSPSRSAKSNIEPWNCADHSGPIQIVGVDGEPRYDVSQLNVTKKTYERLFQIPLDRPAEEGGFQMQKALNAAAFNPVDGIVYAVTRYNDENYIVRFDDKSIEYVARLAPLTNWTHIEDDMDRIYIGGISLTGTYFFGGHSKTGNGTDMLAVQNISDYQGYAKYNDVNLPLFYNGYKNIAFKNLDASSADVAIATGDFDNSGEQSEWLFLLKGWNFNLGMAKVNHLPEMVFEELTERTPGLDADAAGEKAFGAAWMYKNQVYFSRNNGDGVYHVKTDSIDWTSKTYELDHIMTGTPATTQNDGFNCMTSLPPFPGEYCEPPEVEIDMINGKCPGNSKPVSKKNKKKTDQQRATLNPLR